MEIRQAEHTIRNADPAHETNPVLRALLTIEQDRLRHRDENAKQARAAGQ